MNDVGRRKLRTWLQKSLSNHPEGDSGLVDYVEAIVGDAEGEDDELREKWTEKLDDFLSENSADFTDVLLNGVRSGNFGKIWRGGGGEKDHRDETSMAGETRANDHRNEPVMLKDGGAVSGVVDADGATRERSETANACEDDGADDNDDDEDDDDEGGRSRRNRRRQREEPPPPETIQPTHSSLPQSEGSRQGQTVSGNKRARVEGAGGGRGGEGNSGQTKIGVTPLSKGGRRGQQGRGNQAQGSMGIGPSMIQMTGGRGPQQINGPSGVGMGSLAMRGIDPRLSGLVFGAPGGPGHGSSPGVWGSNLMSMTAGSGPGGVHQGGFAPPGPMGRNGMTPLMSGHIGMPGSGPGVPGGGRGMPGNGGGMSGIGRGMPGNGRGMPGNDRGMPQGGPGITVRGPGMPGSVGMPPDPGMHGRGTDMEARQTGVGARGPGMRGGLSGMPRGGPGMQGVPRGGAGMSGSGPGIPRNGPGIPRDESGRGRDESGRPRDGPGIHRDEPGILRDRPGMPRDGPGIPRGVPGMPGGRGSGKSMQDRAGANGPRGVGGGLLPTPLTPPGFLGPSRGVRGPPLLPGPPPPMVDGVGVQGGRGAGPLGPRGSVGPGSGREAPEISIGVSGRPDAGRTGGNGGGGHQGGAGSSEGVMVRRPPERRSPNSGPLAAPQAFGLVDPAGGPRGPGRGEIHGTGLSRPGPLDRQPGDMRNEERGGIRGPVNAFEGGDTTRHGPERGTDHPSEHSINSMPRRPDGRGPMEVSRGAVMRQSGRSVPDVSGEGEKAQDARRSVFERLGTRLGPEDDEQGQNMRQQQQRPTGFHPGSNNAHGNAPEDVRRNPSNNSFVGQRGQRVMPNGGSGPDMRNNAQASGGSGQGSWSGPPTILHDGIRVGPSVGPKFHRGGGGGGEVLGSETRQYPTKDLARGGSEGESRRQYSPTGPGSRPPPRMDPMRKPIGPQINAGEGALRQGGPGNEQGQARPSPIEPEIRHVGPRGGHFETGSSRPVSGAGPGPGRHQRPGGEDRGIAGSGFRGGGGGGISPPKAIGDGYPRYQQQVESGVAFQSSFSSRNDQTVGSGDQRTEGGSRAWGHTAAGEGGSGGGRGSRSLPTVEIAHSLSQQPQQGSASGGRGVDRGQYGGGPRRGGSVSWGNNQGQQLRRGQRDGHESRGFETDRNPTASASEPQSSRAPDHFSTRQSSDGVHANSRRPDQGQGRDAGRDGRMPHVVRSPLPAARATVRVGMVPADVGETELLRHFEAFGEVVEMRIRAVRPDEGGKGQKEALVQFVNPREAQACVASPKPVADNRFIVVQLSEVNLIDGKPSHSFKDRSAAEAVVRAEAAVAARVEAAAAVASRKKAQEKLLAQASKTKEVVAQQKLLILLRERVNLAAQELEATRTKRDKVQDLLRMMEERHTPESEQIKYRKRLNNYSAKVLTLEVAAEANEMQAQTRKLEDLEAEARAMGAIVPPPPNAAVIARLMLMDGGRGRGEASRGRGLGRGRGHGATLTSAPSSGRGIAGSSAASAHSLDNRPTTVKVSGLPEGAGEGDLRVHANMAGVVVGAAMLDRPGEGVVKFAERWAAENFMAKSKSFGGIPLSMSWYTAPFPSQQSRPHQDHRQQHYEQVSAGMAVAMIPAPLQKTPTVNSRTGDNIELKLTSVQDEKYDSGAREDNCSTGKRGWDDTLGKEEGVAWGDIRARRGDHGRGDSGGGGGGDGGGGRGDSGRATRDRGGGNGNGSGSPMQFPRVEGDEDEVYQDMGF